ncbi:MAG: sugar phosphate nucleotidyltransferase [Elusimicrobia bacterium]|nr:sugar phosphate nucleotidyltransferase [Elusimicrobiota bacterium]
MKAVILSAGEGRRLHPFTMLRPKSVLPLANRPLILYIVEFLAELGIKDIGVVTGYRGEEVKKVLNNGGNPGVNLTYFEQKNLNGPLDGILSAKDFINETTILICANSFFQPVMIKELIEQHIKLKAKATIAGGIMERPLYHYKVSSGENNQLKEIFQITEGKQIKTENIVAGIAVIEKEIFDLFKSHGANQTEKQLEWEEIFFSIKDHVKVHTSKYEFVNMAYPWEIHRSNFLALEYLMEKRKSYISNKAKIGSGVTFEGKYIIEDDVIVEPGCFIENSWIGERTKVFAGSYVKGALIGKDCKIGPQCKVGAIVGDGSTIGYNNQYGGVALGKVGFSHQGAIVGVWGDNSGASANCCMCSFRNDNVTLKLKIDGKLVDSGLTSLSPFIGDNCFLNPGVKVMPGKKIGPNSFAGPNMVVYSDIPPDTMAFIKQELEFRTTGKKEENK